MKAPHPMLLAVWSFWWFGTWLYTYGLATGSAWAIPVGALFWLASFGWIEALPLRMRRPEWTFSCVVGWLMWRPSKGQDPSWDLLADVAALPIAVLILATFVALFGGWIGWTLGLALGGLTFVLLRRHFRWIARNLGAWQ